MTVILFTETFYKVRGVFFQQNSTFDHLSSKNEIKEDHSKCRLKVDNLNLHRKRSFKEGDSRVLHCAFLLRTIFASSARAHEPARVQNIRDFPQTKLVSEIKSSFSLKRAR